jgi:hypothetical protein
VVDVLVYVLKTVIAHATHEEPTSNVLILLKHHWTLSLSTPVNINACKMAWKLAFVLRHQPPFREFLGFSAFDKQPADLVAAEFEPEHVVGQVQVEIVLVGILLEKLTLGHQILLGFFLSLAWLVAASIHLLTTNIATALRFICLLLNVVLA